MEYTNIAKIVGKSLPISTKHAVEICNLIRKKTTEQSKTMLAKVIEKKLPVPFKRYKGNIGHKTGIGPGRYPKKASLEILKLIKGVEANAKQKGLTGPFLLKSIIANKGTTMLHYGRKRRIKMKRTNIEIIIEEIQKASTKNDRT